MSVYSLIKEALEPIAPVQASVFEQIDGSVDTYIVVNCNTTPTDYADDMPGHEINVVLVHLFAPHGANNLGKHKAIKRALYDAGFGWPTRIDASDRDGQHHVYECSIATEVD